MLKFGLVSAAKAKSIKFETRKQTQPQSKNGVEVVDKAKKLVY
ncbi:hypothetical protein [Candidatus Methylobacter oryzae]|uniref:DUF2058 domain-containing protein n=1 Tax=Candidatus Methylobacter oryzae TaxID=2497749 RepID=A0ABY3CAN2_9GAMM|nr:hypothetical protein [Candidatus Methylobacter oryzae]TRW93315.1 DUF2058 domain-containing protein [Candidatus Methylobacter oryzae]